MTLWDKLSSLVVGVFKRIGYWRIYRIIERTSLQNDNFFFVQIGSNDGQTGDPIHKFVTKYNWRGVLIEPVNYLFNKLTNNYRGVRGLSFENVAVDEEDGYKMFYRIEQNNEATNPYWYDQLGSFNKEVILKSKELIPNFDTHLISEQIPTMSFKSLLLKHNIQSIDLVHIDTEGYDYNIIKSIPFSNLKPKMILYEHKHLSVDHKKECRKLLSNQGYKMIRAHPDTFAYLG